MSIIGIPRALNLKVPFGCTVGAPNDIDQQLRVLQEALDLVVSAKAPGTMLQSDETYSPKPQ
ncbi:MAG: hypothetical protein KGZ50_12285 [Peptococcaceae bacterium]|nr:hypothetical protein [Peptococcaceae bacterium]